MSQAKNFYPIVNIFKALSVFAELKDLGMQGNGRLETDLTFQAIPGTAVYHLNADTQNGVCGYCVLLNDRPLEQTPESPTSAESIMNHMVNEYEEAHKGKLPFVMMVKDANDEVRLFLDGSIRIKSERGEQLVEMAERHPDMVTQALENILTSVV